MILILTNSTDGSSDILCQLCKGRGLDVLRFNIDLFQDYHIAITPGTFRIADPTGRAVDLPTITCCYWRKPEFYTPLSEDACPAHERAWVQNHVSYLTREIANLCGAQGKLRLVDPHAERRFGKIMQMSLAEAIMDVPRWQVGVNVETGRGQRVVKTLTPDMIETEARRFVYSTPVDASELSMRYPWFVQDLAAGTRDATVLYVLGDCYSFQMCLPREATPSDWRELIGTESCKWEPHLLPPHMQDAIRRFMQSAGLHFGRLDFITDGTQYWFLEVNSNGQYGWLDQSSDFPLHNRILDAILDPRSTVRPFGRVV